MPKPIIPGADQQSHCPLHVLLVEDHQVLAGCLCRRLESQHHRVVRVADLETAQAELAEQSFDLVIADVHAQEEDTAQLLKSAKRIPPFVITMSAYDAAPERGTEGPKPRHLVKPFPAEDLDALLDEFQQQFSRTLAAEAPVSRPALSQSVGVLLRDSARRRHRGEITQAEFDQKLARLCLEDLQPMDLELLVRNLSDGKVRFLIKSKKTGAICEMIDCSPEASGE